MIGEVLSQKFSDIQVFRDVQYEWEEEIAKHFGINIRSILIHNKNVRKNVAKELLKTVFPFLRILKRRANILSAPLLNQDINAPLSLCFLMSPSEIASCSGNNILPVFLDVWSNDDINLIIRSTQKLKLFYVTSRDVFNRIRSKAPSSNIRYMPLSVSNKYYSENFASYRHKTIDVVQMGRRNSVLHEYMLKYASEHKSVDYVCSDYIDVGSGSGNTYVSTTRGMIGKLQGREEFINFLASAKVCLVSSPGMDNSRANAFGVNFLTPRFYESAVLGCALIGRYPDNQEFTELNMHRYCPNITSYEQFVECLEHALSQTPEELYAQNREFIINSLTSKRAEQIQHDLEALVRCSHENS